ncbi:MAG: chaperonin [Bacteroidetes bacterium MedPE-SWsnd-G2]|nr:MAG: chaperonin [Bacteroidetes bacterium MedPE-SWsnd-G2]
MKRVIFSILVCISFTVNAQHVERELGEFNEVKVHDGIHVELIKSDSNKIEITGEHANEIQLINNNGLLKIKMKLKELVDWEETRIKLYFVHLDLIDANEGSRIVSTHNFKQYELDVRAQEGARIELNAETSYLNLKPVTGGIINVSGKVRRQELSIHAGGIYEGENLVSEVTHVTIKAAGEAYVNCTKVLDIKLKAGGDVFVYGKPKSVSEDKVFGGRIKYME